MTASVDTKDQSGSGRRNVAETSATAHHCPGDVILLPAGDDRWVAMNVFARTSLGLDGDGLQLMRDLAGGRPADQTARVWEIERFSNLDGLLADPSRFRRDVADWPDAEILDTAEFQERLAAHCLLVADMDAYRARFAPKRNVLDREHFGSFHEQMGQHLMLNKRAVPDEWWLFQKFTDDLTGLRDNLYGAIQGFNLPRYFEKRLRDGEQVVDLGCGPGFFSNQMAAAGATVLGVDPNVDYIAAARKNAHPNARFEVMDIGTANGCDVIPDESADVVFMSDALLFYFSAHDAGKVPDIDGLFADIRRILKPDGQFISLEPHYVFWLTPWLGDPDRPFTVLSEYRDPRFRVTETISGLVQAFCKGGFAVTWMEELVPDPKFERTDSRAFHFARQFPLWHLFELSRVDSGARAR